MPNGSDYNLISTWAEVDAAAQAVKNGVPEEKLAQSVRQKLNATEKPEAGWAEVDLAQAVRDKLDMGGGVGECSTAAATAASPSGWTRAFGTQSPVHCHQSPVNASSHFRLSPYQPASIQRSS